MNVFIVDPAAHELLEAWRTSHVELARQAISEDVWFFDRFEIRYRCSGWDISVYAERHRSFFELKLYDDIGRICTLKLMPSAAPGEDIRAKVLPCRSRSDGLDTSKDGLGDIIRQVMLNAISINALLLFGNLIEPSERRVSAGSVSYDGGDRTFVFKPYKDTCYAVAAGSHRSPEGVFPVRGHFRRYKDGKVVWIESYFKGTD